MATRVSVDPQLIARDLPCLAYYFTDLVSGEMIGLEPHLVLRPYQFIRPIAVESCNLKSRERW